MSNKTKCSLSSAYISGERVWLYICDCGRKLTETNFDRLTRHIGTHMTGSDHCIEQKELQNIDVQVGPIKLSDEATQMVSEALGLGKKGNERPIDAYSSFIVDPEPEQNVFGFCGTCRSSPCVCQLRRNEE